MQRKRGSRKLINGAIKLLSAWLPAPGRAKEGRSPAPSLPLPGNSEAQSGGSSSRRAGRAPGSLERVSALREPVVCRGCFLQEMFLGRGWVASPSRTGDRRRPDLLRKEPGTSPGRVSPSVSSPFVLPRGGPEESRPSAAGERSGRNRFWAGRGKETLASHPTRRIKASRPDSDQGAPKKKEGGKRVFLNGPQIPRKRPECFKTVWTSARRTS